MEALLIAGAGMAVGGTALQVVANNKASRAQEKEARFNAQMNYDLADSIETSTRFSVGQLRRTQKITAGQDLASASAGLAGGLGGNAQDILAANAVQDEIAVQAARYQGYLEKDAALKAAAAGQRAASSISGMRPYQTATTVLQGLQGGAQLGARALAMGA
jgi:hypothetical protein